MAIDSFNDGWDGTTDTGFFFLWEMYIIVSHTSCLSKHRDIIQSAVMPVRRKLSAIYYHFNQSQNSSVLSVGLLFVIGWNSSRWSTISVALAFRQIVAVFEMFFGLNHSKHVHKLLKNCQNKAMSDQNSDVDCLFCGAHRFWIGIFLVRTNEDMVGIALLTIPLHRQDLVITRFLPKAEHTYVTITRRERNFPFILFISRRCCCTRAKRNGDFVLQSCAY